MKTFKKILSVLCLVPGILLTIYGATMVFWKELPVEVIFVDDCCFHEENEGKYVYMTGTLHYDTKAADDDFRVEFASPGVSRIVSMYQYYEDGYGDMQTGWSSRANGDIKVGNVWYHNGKMPDGLLLGETFLTVPMTMEDGDLLIDDDVSRYLCIGENYFDLNQSYDGTMVEVTDLPETDNAYGFFSTGSYYTNSSQTEIGTIRVSYSYLDFEQIKDREFTVSGVQKDGCVNVSIFTDKVMTVEEIEEAYDSNRTTGSVTAAIMGLIVLAIGLAGFFRLRKGK